MNRVLVAGATGYLGRFVARSSRIVTIGYGYWPDNRTS